MTPTPVKVKTYEYSGVYIIKGDEVDYSTSDCVEIQSGGVSCNHHLVLGDWYQLCDDEEEQNNWIFNSDFWYFMHGLGNGKFISPPLEFLKKIDWHDPLAYKADYDWILQEFGVDMNLGKEDMTTYFARATERNEALEKAVGDKGTLYSDIPKMIEDAVLKISGLKIKVVSEYVEEAFVRIEVLEGDLQGPAILTWDNCD